MEENNILNITDENGNAAQIEVLDIFTVDAYPGKEYILYTKGETEGDLVKSYVSILEETEDTANLLAIEDEEEFNKVQDAINLSIEEGE